MLTPSPSFVLSVQGVSKRFETGFTPLKNIQFDLPSGQFLAVLGPSGCGKTTLLRLLAGLSAPTSGTILKNQAAEETRLAYVFQEPELLPWRTVQQNVELPLELLSEDSKKRQAIAEQALKEVGLEKFRDYYPSALSGGMKMRVSLARALVNQPSLLLLDEPFAALDEVTRFILDESLLELWKSRSMTVVFVTHSISEAAFLSQRVLLLGRQEDGIAHDILNPLPSPRNMELRTTAAFGQFCKELFDKFQGLKK